MTLPFKVDIRWREGDELKIKKLFLQVEAVRKLRGKGGLFERYLTAIPQFISKNFLTQGTRLGLPWPPLSPDYAYMKNLKYPGRSMLTASGYLRMAATIPNAPGNFVQWVGNVMTYGVDTSKFKGHYPASHQHGAHLPARDIEARNAKALHFWYKGKEVFAKKVHIKAGRIPQRAFMALADEDLTALAEETADYMQEIIDK